MNANKSSLKPFLENGEKKPYKKLPLEKHQLSTFEQKL